MAHDRRTSLQPSLRRRFAVWFGLVFVCGAVLFRVMSYQAAVDAVARDVDIHLWSRLGSVKAQERFAPDSLLDWHERAEDIFLPRMAVTSRWAVPHALGRGVPRIAPEDLAWFAGVWRRDGSLIDDLGLPAGMVWDPAWNDRCDTIWTAPDGGYRLAATTGAHDTVLVAGMPLAPLAAAGREALIFQAWTFLLWVPLMLGVVWLLLGRLLAPLEQIAGTASRIGAGRFDERIDAARTDVEYRPLALTLNDMLDRLDAIRMSQTRFNADLAHQLLNPVHAILLEADTGRASSRSVNELDSSLARIDGLARRVEGICEVLLSYARSAALDPQRLKLVDLEPIIAAAIERVGPEAARRGIEIVPPADGFVVKGDASLLEEVVVNLLDNAVEHSPAGGHVEVTVNGDVAGCRVAIVDHGQGVPEDVLPRLFERFHSGRHGGGHGIGLALSRLIARSHGGDVVHEPTAGGGATFVIRLPPHAS